MVVGFVIGVGGGYASRRRTIVAKTTTYRPVGAPKFGDSVGEAPVYDISGKKLVLKDVVSAEPKTTIIAWLRHYGCSLCRKQILELSALSKELKDSDMRFIAIGSGTAQQGAEFLKETNFPGEIYSDPKRRTYQALNFTKGILSTFNLPALGRILGSLAGGNKQRLEVIPTDAFQQGGCLLVNKEGQVLMLHKDEFAGDHVADEILKESIENAK